jgi:hypothetical protein
MKIKLNILFLFIIQSIIATLTSLIIIGNSKYSAGAIGMVPILIFVIQIIQLIFTLILYFLTKSIIKHRFHYIYLFINLMVLILIIGLDEKSFLGVIKDTVNGFVARSIIISQILSSLLVFIYYKYSP